MNSKTAARLLRFNFRDNDCISNSESPDPAHKLSIASALAMIGKSIVWMPLAELLLAKSTHQNKD